MPPSFSCPAPVTPASRPVRVGFLAQTSAAPLVAAVHRGEFARRDLNVTLHREVGWTTLRDKLIYGELDAVQAPAPMLWSTQLGVGCPPCEVLTALVLNRQGHTMTLSERLWRADVRDAVSLRKHLRERPARAAPLSFGVTFPYSSHQLWLLESLRSTGIELGRQARIVVVPAAQLLRHLATGSIDGFCAEEPWGSQAVREGSAWLLRSLPAEDRADIGNVLMVTRRFADNRKSEHALIVQALLAAAVWSDNLAHRRQLAEVLAQPQYLPFPSEAVAPALLGKLVCGHGVIAAVPDFLSFHRNGAAVPAVADAEVLQRSLAAAGLVPTSRTHDASLPRTLFREDLHHDFLSAMGHEESVAASTSVVADGHATSWPRAAHA